MTLFPNTDSALVIGLFLLAIAVVIIIMGAWLIYPVAKAKHRQLHKRLDDLEVKVHNIEVSNINDYTDILEDELYHQRRRNTGKHKRKQ